MLRLSSTFQMEALNTLLNGPIFTHRTQVARVHISDIDVINRRFRQLTQIIIIIRVI